MIKIDFDNFIERIAELRECLNEIPKPLWVRISGSGRGIHIISYQIDDKAYRERFDDPQRFKLDQIRVDYRLTNNVLADVNSKGTTRNVASEWIIIKNKKDIINFINKILLMRNQYYERIYL